MKCVLALGDVSKDGVLRGVATKHVRVDSDRPRESRGTTYTVSIRFIDFLEAA